MSALRSPRHTDDIFRQKEVYLKTAIVARVEGEHKRDEQEVSRALAKDAKGLQVIIRPGHGTLQGEGRVRKTNESKTGMARATIEVHHLFFQILPLNLGA